MTPDVLDALLDRVINEYEGELLLCTSLSIQDMASEKTYRAEGFLPDRTLCEMLRDKVLALVATPEILEEILKHDCIVVAKEGGEIVVNLLDKHGKTTGTLHP